MECREREYEILTSMVKMPFSSCYSKEASKWCQVTAVFKKKSQMSGAEEERRLISPGDAWLVVAAAECWVLAHTVPRGCETPVMGPKPSKFPSLGLPFSLLPNLCCLPGQGQQGMGRWPWRAPSAERHGPTASLPAQPSQQHGHHLP